MAGLKTHLQELTAHFQAPYFPIERFTLAHGKVHIAQPLPPQYKRGRMKECFRNAALLATRSRLLCYAEGIAFRYIPIHHAWCVDKAGRVIDPTWDNPMQAEYMGVEIPTAMLNAEIRLNGYWGVLNTPRGANKRFMEAFAKLPA